MATLLTADDFLALDEEGLLAFLDRGTPENPHIDFKLDLHRHPPGSRTIGGDDRREFLKDVSGFANADGGMLVIGADEPRPDKTSAERAVGLNDGADVAAILERLAVNSIDPPIPGLRFHTVRLTNARAIVLVRIPQSTARPHMVRFEKTRTFYVRHSESTDPMTTFEIREAVLSSATAEARVEQYLTRHRDEVADYFATGPTFLLQAAPMIPLERSLDLEDPAVREAFATGRRRETINEWNLDLTAPNRPRPTLYGLIAASDREHPDWISEIHRRGYLHVAYRVPVRTLPELGERSILFPAARILFDAFCRLLLDVWTAAQVEAPYMIRCEIISPSRMLLFRGRDRGHGEWKRQSLSLEPHVRQIGESLDALPDAWIRNLYHAFGEERVPPIR